MNGVIRLASAPINWGITTPGEDGNPEPDELLDSVEKTGYTGCEIGPFDYFGQSADEINALFARHHLDVVAFWVDVPLHEPLSEERRTWLNGVCQRLQAMNAPFLIVSDLITEERLAIVARVPQFPELQWTDEQWKQVRLTLIDIAAICTAHDLTLAVHPHLGGHIESGDEVAKLIEAIDGTDARLCIDSGHIRIGGVDAIPILARELHRTVHVHAKDIDESVLKQLQDGSIGVWDAVASGLFCDLGTGMVDWQGFRDALVDGDYSGWVVAEEDRLLSPGSRAPYISNERNYVFLKELLGEAVAV